MLDSLDLMLMCLVPTLSVSSGRYFKSKLDILNKQFFLFINLTSFSIIISCKLLLKGKVIALEIISLSAIQRRYNSV